jgi:hypothetical protein
MMLFLAALAIVAVDVVLRYLFRAVDRLSAATVRRSR